MGTRRRGQCAVAGARLKDVLGRANIRQETVEIVLNGADGPVVDGTPDFVKSIPIDKALDDNTLILATLASRIIVDSISTSWHRPREAREATLGCSRQSEADVSVKLLSSLVEHEARTAFDPHLVGILVVGGQPGERDASVYKLLDRANIDAEAFADLTSHIPARNVPTIPEEGATVTR